LYSDDFNTADDNDPFLIQGSFTKFDATITLSNPDNTWELSLIGRNLFDEQTSSAGNDLPLSAGSYFQFLDRPRTVSIQARYNWK
jgi:outer membrane receptor protein involved in Fe transport